MRSPCRRTEQLSLVASLPSHFENSSLTKTVDIPIHEHVLTSSHNSLSFSNIQGNGRTNHCRQPEYLAVHAEYVYLSTLVVVFQ